MATENETFVVSEHLRSAPADVVDLIRKLGISYEEKPMEYGADGRIDFDGNSYKITVNSNQSRQRRKFTAAHEVAHFLLHRDLLRREGHLDRLFDAAGRNNPSAPFTARHEVEANKLAAQILMPRDAIISRMVWEEYNLRRLADAFGVSPAAMEIRLKVLGIDLEKERAREESGEFERAANLGAAEIPF